VTSIVNGKDELTNADPVHTQRFKNVNVWLICRTYAHVHKNAKSFCQILVPWCLSTNF